MFSLFDRLMNQNPIVSETDSSCRLPPGVSAPSHTHMEPDPVDGQGPLEDMQFTARAVSDPGGGCSSGLAGHGEDAKNPSPLLPSETML